MIKPINIKNNYIGEEYPTFLIAEMACAHQGKLENACELVNVAVNARVDAIQIQVFKKELYMSPIHKDYKLITQLEFSQEEWLKLIELIKKSNCLFFAAGYDKESIEFLIENDVDAFKIHSSDTSNPEILREMAKSQKPIFLSCGASKVEEIQNAINFLYKNGSKDIVLMHGYQSFPTKIEDLHLNYIKTLRKLFNLNVGFYDHVDGGSILAKIIPIMAIGYGAKVIEKHLILSRDEKGIDYESSLDQKNFIEFSKTLRECEKAIGSEKIRNFSKSELEYRKYCKKSIVAWKDIPKETKITRDMVRFVRGDPGIPPDEFKDIQGRETKKNIIKYNNIYYEDFY